jgi:predicted acyltransferase
MFMVGVALAYSLAARRARGQSFGRMFGHALLRSAVLVLLGIALRSVGKRQTYFTFEDVLTQIGLGYPLLFLLAWLRPRWQAAAAVVILVGDWAAFAACPLPAADFDTRTVSVPRDWPHKLSGFAAHWNKNTNPAARADQWFLNRFPRDKAFVANGGGYQTLNFVPSLATMLFGLLAGELLRGALSPARKAGLLAVAGVAGLAIGGTLDAWGICPNVKRIWTPTWAVYSTGWTCLLLAGFFAVVDWRGWRRWTFPMVVVGANSIAMYCLVHVCTGFVGENLKVHLGQQAFLARGDTYAEPLEGAAVLAVFWLVCLWMYRRRLFLRI